MAKRKSARKSTRKSARRAGKRARVKLGLGAAVRQARALLRQQRAAWRGEPDAIARLDAAIKGLDTVTDSFEEVCPVGEFVVIRPR
jgi:hypothetical protein